MQSTDSSENAFEFFSLILSDINDSYIRLFELVKEVMSVHKKEADRQPYHINVIDELHINENAHSRILARLLQYKNSASQYEILESFINFIKRKVRSSAFDRIRLKSPAITQEEQRVDLWIRDWETGYALIIENKIYSAPDQTSQLYRYIEATRDNGAFKDKQIYVFYLTQYGNEPNEQTWKSDETGEDLKERFSERYMALSFNDDILPWLKVDVLPNIRQKDQYLLSAVMQYIDYLEGLFSKREINKSLNMELQKIISDRLGLEKCSNLRERYQLLQDMANDMDKVLSQVNQMCEETYISIQNEHVQKWKDQIKSISGSKKFKIDENVGIGFGVRFKIKGKDLILLIGHDGRLYCQIEFDSKEPEEEQDLNECGLLPIIAPILSQGRRRDCKWKYFEEMQFDEVFACFNQVISAIEPLIV